MSRGPRIAIALAYGIANHALFVVAIGVMVMALHGGLGLGLGRLEGGAALAANTLLALQFPLIHSFLLARRGRGVLARLAPRALGSALAPTTFAALASAQLLVTFLCWSPSGIVLFEATGGTRWVFEGLFAASWLFLVKALYDAGLPIQTGSIGWTAVLRGDRPDFGTFPTAGLFRICRQPVYLAFAATLWTGPVLTLDRLALAVAWTAYCIVGPLHKERRYLSHYGNLYSNYRRSVPYILPGFRP
ncbi:MAG: isoprenylcysteine carboxylmethyltransferase family protein [Planctomycetes bacterium]|nr:isoprenylcysteine carboxylmethyltransferase family protein [Planctomycetota bacterium]